MTGDHDHVDLPADNHVHSEWSWDALAGSMWRTCERAAELGLPAVAFTEHADFTPWSVEIDDAAAAGLPAPWAGRVAGGVFSPPPFDLHGYHDCLDACREAFPALRILSGVELSEPHWHPDRSSRLLAEGRFERVLASVHAAPVGEGFREIGELVTGPAGGSDGTGPVQPVRGHQLVREYLAEVERLAEGFDGFEVLAHIDYPIRYWAGGAQAFDPQPLKDPFRATLATLARTGRVLEINTRIPLAPVIVDWWRREGGRAVTFGSDAHDPDSLARGFREAAAMAEAQGFRPGRSPHEPWPRA